MTAIRWDQVEEPQAQQTLFDEPIGTLSSGASAGGGGAAEEKDVTSTSAATSRGPNQLGTVRRVGAR